MSIEDMILHLKCPDIPIADRVMYVLGKDLPGNVRILFDARFVMGNSTYEEQAKCLVELLTEYKEEAPT